jgi:hypothetical protein
VAVEGEAADAEHGRGNDRAEGRPVGVQLPRDRDGCSAGDSGSALDPWWPHALQYDMRSIWKASGLMDVGQPAVVSNEISWSSGFPLDVTGVAID